MVDGDDDFLEVDRHCALLHLLLLLLSCQFLDQNSALFVADGHLDHHCHAAQHTTPLDPDQFLLLELQVIGTDPQPDLLFGLTVLDHQIHLKPLLTLALIQEPAHF